MALGREDWRPGSHAGPGRPLAMDLALVERSAAMARGQPAQSFSHALTAKGSSFGSFNRSSCGQQRRSRPVTLLSPWAAEPKTPARFLSASFQVVRSSSTPSLFGATFFRPASPMFARQPVRETPSVALVPPSSPTKISRALSFPSCEPLDKGGLAVSPPRRSHRVQRSSSSLSLSREAKRQVQAAEETQTAPAVASVEEATKRYTEAASIRHLLEDGTVILLRGSWLVEHAKTEGARLPCRSEVPPHAMWKPEELTVGDQLRAGHEIVAISHCWPSPDHADPDGQKLLAVGACIDAWAGSRPGMLPNRVAVFMDWFSLEAFPLGEPLDPENSEPFSAERRAQSVYSSELWYAHRATHVWLLTHVPADSTPFHQHAWPFFEEVAAAVFSPQSNTLDLGPLQRSPGALRGVEALRCCATKRRPPMAPKALARALKSRSFSVDGAASEELLASCYEQ
ncbi:unnamed protein product, partial [Polarella glacialis]